MNWKLLLCALFLATNACVGSKLGSQSKGEVRRMNLLPSNNLITSAMMLESSDDLFAASQEGASRGLGITTHLVGLATNGIKEMIADEKKKYQAGYRFALNDLYFYESPSFNSPFDPVGMQFNGFTVERFIKDENDSLITAFSATFEPDMENLESIIRDGFFRLKLTDLKLDYAKAKISDDKENKLNMDIEISFMASYLTADGVMHSNELLGTFITNLRGVPIMGAEEDYAKFIHNPSMVSGKSFIVPRSYSYQYDHYGDVLPVYSQGAYSIMVNIRESSKNNFVNTLILDNSPMLIDQAAGKITPNAPKRKSGY